MLQIDHIYKFLYENLFQDFEFWTCPGGVVKTDAHITIKDITLFTPGLATTKKIFFYDQEPFISDLAKPYIDLFIWERSYTVDEHITMAKTNTLPSNIQQDAPINEVEFLKNNPQYLFKEGILVSSELSSEIQNTIITNKFKSLYYFFHGFAALDWYRGYYALNSNKSIVKPYKYDFISFNRIITNDRSYRIYFVSQLNAQGLLPQGQVSFNVTDNLFDDWQDETSDLNSKLSATARQHIEHHLIDISKLVIDRPELPGSASADILHDVDAFWHVVTETVFYYDKLHLTEKIFKPIVSKQPFMLLAAPGNLAYLKSYGFKTFDCVIDESYDLIQDNDLRIEAVVNQLHWYCNLTPGEKIDIIQQLEPIIDYNFHHFYGEFRHIIARELLDNTKTLFKEIGYDDCHINYTSIHHVLTH